MSSIQESQFMSSEEVAGHSIRANHELMMDLCLAMDGQEAIHNDLPDLFGLMTEDGRIIRANSACARTLEVDHEDISSCSLRQAFTDESWMILTTGLHEVGITQQKSLAIALPIDGINPKALYHFTLTPYNVVSNRRGQIFSFFGKDISKVRDLENSLATIYSAIPLGVVTIDAQCQIEWPYSAYSEVMLRHANLNQSSAQEVLFGRSKRFMTKTQQEAIDILFEQLGAEQEWFDMNKENFPKEVPIGESTASEPQSWLRFGYSPVIRNGTVDKILVTMEDITSVVQNRQSSHRPLTKEEKMASVLSELKDVDHGLLGTSIDNINTVMSDIAKRLSNGDPVRSIYHGLHGIKGVARVANLKTFQDFVHNMESRLITNAPDLDARPNSRIRSEIALLSKEWMEVLKYVEIYEASHSYDGVGSPTPIKCDFHEIKHKCERIVSRLQLLKDGDMRATDGIISEVIRATRLLTCISLAGLSERLERFFAATAINLHKSADIHFDWGDCEIDAENAMGLCEILYHLISNGLDHGIETPDTRVQFGKQKDGSVTIKCEDMGQKLLFTFEDDGAGINIQKVLAHAKKQGLVPSGSDMTDDEVCKFILRPEFSTADQLTDVSGRGIGLSAVNEKIQSLGGGGLRIVQSIANSGTTFSFELKKFS